MGVCFQGFRAFGKLAWAGFFGAVFWRVLEVFCCFMRVFSTTDPFFGAFSSAVGPRGFNFKVSPNHRDP